MNSEPSILGVGWTDAEVRHFVDECYDRDTNLNVLLGFSGKYLEKRMILILGRSILQPFMIQGWVDHSPEVLKSARIPRGKMPTTLGMWEGQHYSALFDVLNIEPVSELFAVPIPIGNRVTAMILGVPRSDQRAEELSEISEFVGTQLEKLIRLSKTGELPKKENRIPAAPIRSKDSDVSNESLQAHVLAATETNTEKEVPSAPADIDFAAEEIKATETAPDAPDLAADKEMNAPEVAPLAPELTPATPIVSKINVQDSEVDVRSTLSLSGDVSETSLGIEDSDETGELNAGPFSVVPEPTESYVESTPAVVDSTDYGLPVVDTTSETSVSMIDNYALKPDIEATDASSTAFGLPLISAKAPETSKSSTATDTEKVSSKDDPTSTAFGLPLIEARTDSSASVGSETSAISESKDDELTVNQAISIETIMSHASNAKNESKINVQLALDSELDFQSPVTPSRNISEGVSIMIPKSVNADTSSATLMGGVGVDSDLVQKSLRETSVSIEIEEPEKERKRATPGAAIFRARKKSGKVGGFIPQPTKETEPIPASVKPAPNEVRSTLQLDDFPEVKEKKVYSDKETHPELPSNVIHDMNRKIHDSNDLKKWDIKDDSESLGEWSDLVDDVLDPAVFDNMTSNSDLSMAAKSIILESGPKVKENQEHFLMIDSRDKKVAFSAAQKVAELGKDALPFLDTIFPGRIFIDRYQYTAQTMPNASEHTPVLDCLSRIGGNAALEIPMSYLDDKSTETRFYAVYLLMNFECGSRISEIYERLFDKDNQIQEVAKNVLASAKDSPGFKGVIERLRNEIQFSQKDHRIEIACDILALMKDRQSVELFIDLLSEQKGRTKTRVHNALQVLTLKDWSTPYEWKQWWRDANAEPRSEWLVTALDSNNEFIRRAAFNEINRIPGLSLNYHVMQPSKLRRRAQRELRAWFDSLSN